MIYIPERLKQNYKELQELLRQYRLPDPADSNTMQPSCVVVNWIGSGKRKVYNGFVCTRVDFDRVTRKTAVFAYYEDSFLVITRTFLAAPRVYIRKGSPQINYEYTR